MSDKIDALRYPEMRANRLLPRLTLAGAAYWLAQNAFEPEQWHRFCSSIEVPKALPDVSHD